MFSIDDIRTCVLVAELGSMRRAADRLSVAPSVVSRQILRLEQVYGSPLFERRPGGIVLTEAGQLFLKTAQVITRALSDFEGELAQLAEGRRGRIKLHSIEGVTTSFLPPLVASFRRANPETSVSLVVTGRKLVLAAVEDYMADIGIVYDHFSNPLIETVAQWKQPLLAFVRPGHPALSEPQETRNLAAWPCALPDQTFGIRRLVNDAHRKRGLKLNPVIVANQLQSLLQAAINDDLVTYMPLQAARHEVTRGRLVPIKLGFREFEYRFASVVVHAARPRAPHVDTFLAAIREAIGPAERADEQLLSSLI